ncbi:ATP-binding cassette domain-containing protein [Nonomuraea sp. NPDC051941]|uniref:ABC transporter ATP-binding protein n=1 Tax=Nonomuraea sp. NPDC051941 TaxID=3364373 RepID=UPI0037CA8196
MYERKGHPARAALDRVDLRIDTCEVHGLLGPNGAGKTTLCKILSTVLLPTSGSAQILGHDVVADTSTVRSLIGIVLGGERGLYGRLTARQNLVYWSALYRQPTNAGKARASALLERVGLADRADERVETFSRGMKQRLHLARGIVGDPQLVILDEPTVGLDPVAAHDFRGLVRELRAEGRTILVTTHDMAEAEAICDRVSLIDSGRLILTEDPRAIGSRLTTFERVVAQRVPRRAIAAVRGLPGVTSVTETANTVTIETGAEGTAHAVLAVLVNAGVSAVTTDRPSLEEVYMKLIGDRGPNVT